MYARWAVQCVLYHRNHHSIESLTTGVNCGCCILRCAEKFNVRDIQLISMHSGVKFAVHTNGLHPVQCAPPVNHSKTIATTFSSSVLELKADDKTKNREELLLWCKEELGFCDDEFAKLSRKKLPPIALVHSSLLVRAFMDGGIPKERIRHMILREPGVLMRCVKQTLEPFIALVGEYGLTKKEALHMLTKKPSSLNQSREEWRTALQGLSELGLSNREIRKIVMAGPWDVGLRFHHDLNSKIDSLINIFGLDRDTIIHSVLVKQPMLGCVRMETVAKAVELFKSWGVSEYRVSYLAAAFPGVFLCQGEILEDKFCFAKYIMEKETCEITLSPRYLAASLQKVIMFRSALLDKHGLSYWQLTLNSLVATNLPNFCEKYNVSDPGGSFQGWWKTLDIEEKYAAIINSKYM